MTDPVEPDVPRAAGVPPTPPPLLASELSRAERRAVWPRIALVSIVVAAVGGLLVTLGGGSSVDPDDALASAQAFVEDTPSYRYRVLTTSQTSSGDPDGAGSDTTTRTVSTGDVISTEQWRSLEEFSGDDEDIYGTDGYEVIRLGSEVYQRGWFGSGFEGVDEPRWVALPVEAFITPLEEYDQLTEDDFASMFPDESGEWYDAGVAVDMATSAYLLAEDGSPAGVTRVVLNAESPTVERELSGGGVELRAVLPPDEEVNDLLGDHRLPPVDVLLELDSQNHPVRARLTAEVEGASSEIDVTFSDWGASDIEIAAPEDDDLDSTPWITEEALATVPELLVAPSVVPQGLELVRVSTYMFDDASNCASVDLEYAPEETAAAFDDAAIASLTPEEMDELFSELPSLYVSITPVTCAEDPDSVDGMLGGHPARGGAGSWELRFGEVWVSISLFPDDAQADADAIAASLATVSLDSLAASIPPWARNSGGF